MNIYGLYDPRLPAAPENVRYVGCTVKKIETRRREHVKTNRYNPSLDDAKNVWIRELVAAGIEPAALLLEGMDDYDEALACEQEWIRTLRAAGNALTNAYAGGQGTRLGKKNTEASKEKLRAWWQSPAGQASHRTPEFRKRISEALTGRQLTEEHKRRISEAGKGRRHTEESKKKMSEKALARPAGGGMTGRQHSEETRAKMKAAWEVRKAAKQAK